MSNNLQTFTPEFKKDCLAYLLKDQVAAKAVVQHLPTDLFDYDPEFHLIFVAFKEFFIKYSCRPRKHELIDRLTDECDKENYDDQRKDAIFKALDEVWEWDQYSASYVKDKLYHSVTAHNILKVAHQIEDYVDEGDYDGLVKAMAAARSTGSEDPDIVEYWSDTAERIKRRKVRTVQNVPTGLTVLDDLINGGLPRGTVGMLQGYSGLGKSAVLAQIARFASLSGFTTAYLTLELEADAVMDRCDAALADIPLQHLILKGTDIATELSKIYTAGRAKQCQPAPFYVQYFPTKSISITQVANYVERLRLEKGKTLDLLVVDYFDLLKMEGTYTKKYEAQEENCEIMRGLAGTYHMSLWTATQTNRGGMSKDTVGMEDIASGFGKVFPLDLLITMSQTEFEKRLKNFRLTIAKSRLGPSNETIYIQPNFEKMRFMDFNEADAIANKMLPPKAKGKGKQKALSNTWTP